MKHYQVVIVGLGPTGMSLALELQKHGIDFFILDKRNAVSDYTRAVNLTPASLALLRNNFQITVDEMAMKTDKIQLYWNNQLVSNVQYGYMKFPYKKFYYLKQPMLENLLYEKIDSSKVKEMAELTDIDSRGNGYELTYKYADSVEKITCDYLIGCDGNNSLVREWMGVENDYEDYQSQFLLFDVELERPISSESLYFVFEDGYIITVPIGDKAYRIIVSFNEINYSDARGLLNKEFLEKIFFEKNNINIVVNKLLWTTCAPFRHRVARESSKGRSFLCGDSYHVFSPIGGLNLNTGIQDAINLGWKLAYVINGKAAPELLATYQSERQIANQTILHKTKLLTHCITHAGASQEAKKFYSSLKNRYEIKYRLPYMLSGYNNYTSDIKEIPGSQNLINHHYSEMINDKNTYERVCRYQDSIRFNLVVSDDFEGKIKNKDINLIRLKESFAKSKWYLLRPDGYISDIGDYSDFNRMRSRVDNLLKEQFHVKNG